MLPDGRARVKAMPKGDPNDTNVLRQFARAVLRAEPLAAGAAVSLYESGKTVTTAFIEAGIFALFAIAILLVVALRRVTDVLLTLFPLLLAGGVTLEIAVVWGLALNFANIVALPLLLGVGVAFKIYYIMAWRAGKTHLLQSTLTRAVVFSAMTNAIAFGRRPRNAGRCSRKAPAPRRFTADVSRGFRSQVFEATGSTGSRWIVASS